MRPYPRKSIVSHNERIFNYRLSRARRVVENSFGILTARFRLFHRPLNFDENKTLPKIVMAALVLHNFLLNECKTSYCPSGFADSDNASHSMIPGKWREGQHNHLETCKKIGSNTYCRSVKILRDKFAAYLCLEGKVHWQNSIVYCGESSC